MLRTSPDMGLTRAGRFPRLGRLAARFGRAAAWIGRRMEWRRQRRALLNLDDRLLRDVGLTRTDVRIECAKPIWQE